MLEACSVDPPDLAQQRRGVGEAALGQDPAHLRFRMHARLDLAQQLHHRLVADHQGRVALLGAQPLQLGVSLDLQISQGVEADFAVARRKAGVGPQALDHRTGEAR